MLDVAYSLSKSVDFVSGMAAISLHSLNDDSNVSIIMVPIVTQYLLDSTAVCKPHHWWISPWLHWLRLFHSTTMATPASLESRSACCSGSNWWWSQLPGWCFLRDTTMSHRYSGSCTGWRRRSELTRRLLFLFTNVYMEQHRRSLLMNSVCRWTSVLVVRRTLLSTIGDRTVPVDAVHLWNGLPHHKTSAPSPSTRGVDHCGTGGTCPPNIHEGGTSMVMSSQYFRSDVI